MSLTRHVDAEFEFEYEEGDLSVGINPGYALVSITIDDKKIDVDRDELPKALRDAIEAVEIRLHESTFDHED